MKRKGRVSIHFMCLAGRAKGWVRLTGGEREDCFAASIQGDWGEKSWAELSYLCITRISRYWNSEWRDSSDTLTTPPSNLLDAPRNCCVCCPNEIILPVFALSVFIILGR